MLNVPGSEPPSWSVLALFGVPFRITRSRNTVLSSTSTFGMVYVARALNDVWTGDETWQYGLVAQPGFSGTAARRSHQSLVTLPVLVPPEKVTPFTLRTLNVRSTPLNTRVSSPSPLVDRISRFCARANASGVRLRKPPTCAAVPDGKRFSESLGVVTENER